MSTRNPTTKRILRESAELAAHPSPDFTAAPLESDLYEWHFTLRGPPAPSPFAAGIYHGRIILPPAYPLKPPSFRFLTPTGRFEVNREICLSISGHHEETWQPAWGIRTALVAIRSFMDSDARGQVGGMEAGEEVRRRLAGSSRAWRCGVCRKSNEEVLREVEMAVRESGEQGKEREEVPEELRLGYRDELGKKEGRDEAEGGKPPHGTTGAEPDTPQTAQTMPAQISQQQPIPQRAPQTPAQPPPAPTSAQARSSGQQHQQQQQQQQQQQRRAQAHHDAVPPWIDKAIYGILGALIFLVWKKFIL